RDIHDDLWKRSRGFSLWAYNDACPPSPGCALPQKPPSPAIPDQEWCEKCVDIWQFAQSPKRKEFASRCSGYSSDGNCYAPSDIAHKWFLDLNTARSPDPSGGAN